MSQVLTLLVTLLTASVPPSTTITYSAATCKGSNVTTITNLHKSTCTINDNARRKSLSR